MLRSRTGWASRDELVVLSKVQYQHVTWPEKYNLWRVERLRRNREMRLARVLPAVLALILAAGAAATPAQAQVVEIDFWSLFTGGDGQIMNEIVARFNEEHPNIKVTHTILDWGDPYYSKLITSTVAGAPPAVGVMHSSRIQSFIEQGLLTALTEKDLELMGISSNDFMPNIWERGLYEGRVYAIPLDVHPYALYMNVPMFEQAGLAVRSPQGEAELLQYVRSLTIDRDGDGIAEVSGFAGYGSREWLGYLYQYGGRIMDEQGMPAFRTDAGRRALEIQREVIRAASDRIFGWFGDQSAAMQLLGPWEIGNFTRLEIDFKTDVAPQVGPYPGTWAESHLLIVPRGVREQNPEVFEAALTFISWLSLNTIEWSAGAGHVPARIDRLTVDSFLALEHQQAFARSLEFSYFWPDHRLEGEFHGQGVWPYLNDEFDVNEALTRLEQAFRNVMFEP